MGSGKSILFLSGLDFKERSIQVIRKTPEAYVQAGWDVTYVVARDRSVKGNYYYEQEINPAHVRVIRIDMPWCRWRDRVHQHLLLTIITKLAGFVVVFRMASVAARLFNKESFSIVYGYEIHGVLALFLLRSKGLLKNVKTVSRFQGTWLTSYLKNKNRIKLFLNTDALWAHRITTDLCIMTDDGTQGDYLYRDRNEVNLRFWVNGVDLQDDGKVSFNTSFAEYRAGVDKILLSVCRLESWKRIDRCIEVVEKLAGDLEMPPFKYLIAGDGQEREKLEQMVRGKRLEKQVIFLGSVPNAEVHALYNMADIFLSAYDLSNVGNPLLEAIATRKIIFTLNNGDTGSWIHHLQNGFIYNIDAQAQVSMARDIKTVCMDRLLSETIIRGVAQTATEKLWTWEERMKAEVEEVEKLLHES